MAWMGECYYRHVGIEKRLEDRMKNMKNVLTNLAVGAISSNKTRKDQRRVKMLSWRRVRGVK